MGVVASSNCCNALFGITYTKLMRILPTCWTGYARVTTVMPWILETIMSHTRCHCLNELDVKWQTHHSTWLYSEPDTGNHDSQTRTRKSSINQLWQLGSRDPESDPLLDDRDA